MSQLTVVRAIMKDIKDTLQKADQTYINLSPGNPVILPEIAQLWKDKTNEIMENGEFDNVVGRYGDSKGYQPFLEAVLKDFNQRYDQNYDLKNILVTPGSQSLYFLATNTYAGQFENGLHKKVLLPITPDYTGYGGVILNSTDIVSRKPIVEKLSTSHRFKYRLDSKSLNIDETIGCVIFSRPCNPTGNVLSQDEVLKISKQAENYNIPVFIDSAYNEPYPALNFVPSTPIFAPNIVHCLTLAKAGLPGERVGVAIADEKYIAPLEAFLTNSMIHSSRMGQAIAEKAISSGELGYLSTSVIRPFYEKKSKLIAQMLDKYLPDSLSWYLHDTEGSIFAWLWIENLPYSDTELYNKLKSKGLLVVPGSGFFPGLEEDWKHTEECIRLSLTATDEELVRACQIIGDVLGN